MWDWIGKDIAFLHDGMQDTGYRIGYDCFVNFHDSSTVFWFYARNVTTRQMIQQIGLASKHVFEPCHI